MITAFPKPIVSALWLAEHLHDPDLRILDVGYLPPERTKTGREHFTRARVPNASFFDVDEIADLTSTKAHAFPSAATFAAKVGDLGIGNQHHVVLYDRFGGIAAAARAWFLFRSFGHEDVSVLEGGWKSWEGEGHQIDRSPPAEPARQSFEARAVRGFVRSQEEMLRNLSAPAFQVVDSRPAANFAGDEADNWPGLRRGHIPGSRNLPVFDIFSDMLSMRFKPRSALEETFVHAGIDLAEPLTATGASGITPCAIALAAHLLGKTDVQIYDGSWVEWGADPSLPIEIGPPRN